MKKDILDEFVCNHLYNIELSLDEYKNQLDAKTREVLDKFIQKMNDDDADFIDQEHNKKYPNYWNFKINSIKVLVYNESDMKTNVVSLICERQSELVV